MRSERCDRAERSSSVALATHRQRASRQTGPSGGGRRQSRESWRSERSGPAGIGQSNRLVSSSETGTAPWSPCASRREPGRATSPWWDAHAPSAGRSSSTTCLRCFVESHVSLIECGSTIVRPLKVVAVSRARNELVRGRKLVAGGRERATAARVGLHDESCRGIILSRGKAGVIDTGQ